MKDISELLKSRNEKDFGISGEEINLRKAKKFLNQKGFRELTDLKLLANIREYNSWGENYGKANKLFTPDIKRNHANWKSSDVTNLKAHAILGILTSIMLAHDDLSKFLMDEGSPSDSSSSKEFEDMLVSNRPVLLGTLQKAI